jgi:hypothetical protein
MVRKDISILEPLADDPSSGELSLSVKISENSLSCAALNTARNMFFAFESWNIQGTEGFFGISDALKKIHDESDLLKRDYKKTSILIDTAAHTIIPSKIYSEENAGKFLEFNFSLRSHENVLVDDLGLISAKNIYWLPYEIEMTADKIFANYNFRHVSSVLVSSLISMVEKNVLLLLHISSDRMDVVVSKDMDLVFCNSFVFGTAEDMIYYILQVYKQLNLDPRNVPLMLAGEMEKRSAAYEILYRYIKDIFFCQPADGISFPGQLSDLKDHKNYCLFNSVVCAS